MILWKLLTMILGLMSLGLAGSLVWVAYEFHDVLTQPQIIIFLVLAIIALSPVALIIHQYKQRS